jgi:hypothetical protein
MVAGMLPPHNVGVPQLVRESGIPRDILYQASRAENPEGWSGPTRNWEPPASVLLNPGKPRPQQDPAVEPSP